MVGIYKVTNQINNKSYIGQSKHIEARWRQHHTEPFNINSDTYDVIFYKAIRKYGIENFIFEVIEECDESMLNEREKYWIAKYNTYVNAPNSNGYNMTRGGEFTWQELKYDIDLIASLWEQGKTHQEIMQITNYDNHILTRYLDYLGISPTERRQRANLYKAKTVYQYHLNGIFIQSYSSISEAARNIAKEKNKENAEDMTSNIVYACNNKIHSAYGYLWSYDKVDKLNKKVKHSKINQYDLNGKYLKTYDTQTAAAKDNQLQLTAINNACTGKSQTASGYIWKYYDTTLDNPCEDLKLDAPIITYNQYTNNRKPKICNRLSIDQFDINGNYIQTYQDMQTAAIAVGLKNKNNIWKACNGNQKTAGGYVWKYHNIS